MGKRGRTGEHQLGRSGPRSNSWKGGRVSQDGYIYVYLGPYGGYRPEHCIMMEQHLGRKLKHNEIVHHINGDKADNRLGNFLLTTRKEHPTHHWTWVPYPRPCCACGKLFVPKRKPRRKRSCCSRKCSLVLARLAWQ